MDENEVIKLLNPAFEKINDLTKHYKTLGYAGFLAVIGAVIIIFTVVVAFQTNPVNPNASLLNVDRYEETLFILSGVFLMVFGGVAFGLRIILKFKLSALGTQLEIAKLSAIAKVKAPVSELPEE